MYLVILDTLSFDLEYDVFGHYQVPRKVAPKITALTIMVSLHVVLRVFIVVSRCVVVAKPSRFLQLRPSSPRWPLALGQS